MKVNKCIWPTKSCPPHIDIPLKGNEKHIRFLKCLYIFLQKNGETYLNAFSSEEYDKTIAIYFSGCNFFSKKDIGFTETFAKKAIEENQHIFRTDMLNTPEYIIMHKNCNFSDEIENRRDSIETLKERYRRMIDLLRADVQVLKSYALKHDLMKIIDKAKKEADLPWDKYLEKCYLQIFDQNIQDIDRAISKIENLLKPYTDLLKHIPDEKVVEYTQDIKDLVKKINNYVNKSIASTNKVRSKETTTHYANDRQQREPFSDKKKVFVKKKRYPSPARLRRYHYHGSNQVLRNRLGAYYPKCRYERIYLDADEVIDGIKDDEIHVKSDQTIIRLVNLEDDWLRLPSRIINSIKPSKFLILKTDIKTVHGKIDYEYKLIYGKGIAEFLIANQFTTPGMVLSLEFQGGDTILVSSINEPTRINNVDYWTLENGKPIRKSILEDVFQYKIIKDIYRLEMQYREIIPIDKGILTVMYEEMEIDHTFPNGKPLSDKDISHIVNKKRPVSVSAIQWMLYLMDCFVKTDNQRWLLKKPHDHIMWRIEDWCINKDDTAIFTSDEYTNLPQERKHLLNTITLPKVKYIISTIVTDFLNAFAVDFANRKISNYQIKEQMFEDYPKGGVDLELVLPNGQGITLNIMLKCRLCASAQSHWNKKRSSLNLSCQLRWPKLSFEHESVNKNGTLHRYTEISDEDRQAFDPNGQVGKGKYERRMEIIQKIASEYNKCVNYQGDTGDFMKTFCEFLHDIVRNIFISIDPGFGSYTKSLSFEDTIYFQQFSNNKYILKWQQVLQYFYYNCQQLLIFIERYFNDIRTRFIGEIKARKRLTGLSPEEIPSIMKHQFIEKVLHPYLNNLQTGAEFRIGKFIKLKVNEKVIDKIGSNKRSSEHKIIYKRAPIPHDSLWHAIQKYVLQVMRFERIGKKGVYVKRSQRILRSQKYKYLDQIYRTKDK